MLPRSREGGGTLVLLLLLLLGSGEGMQQASYEQQRYDGWYNNLAHPNWGSAGKSYDLCSNVAALLGLINMIFR